MDFGSRRWEYFLIKFCRLWVRRELANDAPQHNNVKIEPEYRI